VLEACQITDQGCVRPNNEDYCLVDSSIGLYIIADGMGGARAGERASQLAVETVAEALRLAPNRDAQALHSAVEQAHRRVIEAASRDESLRGMGTTLVAALESGEQLAIASVGDSRAYLFDDAGFRAVTEDQSWVNEVGRPLGLDDQSLRTHPMRHVLTMAVGAGQRLSVKMYMVPFEKGAVAMLSTDGLHGVLRSDRLDALMRAVHQGGKLTVCADRLVGEAKMAGGPDNITVILIRRAREA
jgi:PPM family protein phosphatase